ncbi:MAG: vWA domain-containing protein [Hyphomonas sp.]|uniref:VWA domain-containing protein n=1 Tax=Hyphomonas sp. TaxID=87 RepID=UPI00352985A4
MAQPKTHSYILLDRTGSMSSIWVEALSSVNAYAGGISSQAGDIEPDITLAVFDAQDGLQFDVLRRSVKASGWQNVTNNEASPRGMTPLFDAIARIIALAEADNPDKAVIVIMTDGEENASREVKKEGVKAALDRVEKRGWEVVFLGAEFANFADADAVGIASHRSMAMSAPMMRGSMEKLARKSQAYYQNAEANVMFDETDRAEAGEADVQKRKSTGFFKSKK